MDYARLRNYVRELEETHDDMAVIIRDVLNQAERQKDIIKALRSRVRKYKEERDDYAAVIKDLEEDLMIREYPR